MPLRISGDRAAISRTFNLDSKSKLHVANVFLRHAASRGVLITLRTMCWSYQIVTI